MFSAGRAILALQTLPVIVQSQDIEAPDSPEGIKDSWLDKLWLPGMVLQPSAMARLAGTPAG